MAFEKLPPRLRVYIAAHLIILVPLLVAVARLPHPSDPGLTLFLAGAAVLTATWRVQLTICRSRQSLVFAVACLALLLQGVQAAVLCAGLGALVTHLVRPAGPWWRLEYLAQPLHRRLFNIAHCAVVCALSGFVWLALQPHIRAGWWQPLPELIVFTSVYFVLNTFGVACAQAFEQGVSPVSLWIEHYFWTALGYFASAATAALIWAAYRLLGPAALLLLPCFYLVYDAHRCYVDTLRKQKELAAEINRLYQNEEESNRRKDEFLATLAHELRNPLGAIANAHYMLTRTGGSERPGRHLEIIGAQTGRLRRLVDDLLDVSRITRGVVTLRPEVRDLRRLVQGAVDAVQPLLVQRRHTLTVRVPEEPVPAQSDPDRLEQVLCNLLTNAAKYTPPGGRIEIVLEREGDEAIFRVRDSGIGIDPELLPRVFEPFVQADRSLSHSEGGLGIGLTLVRSLVELHGGRIEARSAGRNQGSEFTVGLPASRAVGPAALPAEPAPEPGPAPVRMGPAVALPVLVVDDQRDAAETLAEMLELWGFSPRVAHTGRQALELCRAETPAVAILDLGLPEMDGYELARRLRADGCGAALIALTGYGRPEERDAALSAGFDHHVVKPADPEALQELVRRLVLAPPRAEGRRSPEERRSAA